jgi:DNA-binding NarL/FixJ family response regulator
MGRRRVLVADAHPLIARGLAAIVQASPEFALSGAVTTPEAVLAQVRQAPPDVILLDADLRDDEAGGDFAASVRAEAPTLRLVLMSAEGDREDVRRALQVSAQGFIIKKHSPDCVLQAVRTVLTHGFYWDQRVANLLAPSAANPDTAAAGQGRKRLTDREEDALRLTACGLPNKEIATRLNVGVKSVETYKARAYQKLMIRNRAEVVRYALQQGWLHA